MKKYFINILIALDQLGTSVVGGYPDETMSSYSYRLDQKGKRFGKLFRPVIDWAARVFFKQENHCMRAYAEEAQRLQFPPELR